jgi:hypothetical protein
MTCCRKPLERCIWLSACDNAATTTVEHPIWGTVPVCDGCESAAQHDRDQVLAGEPSGSATNSTSRTPSRRR